MIKLELQHWDHIDGKLHNACDSSRELKAMMKNLLANMPVYQVNLMFRLKFVEADIRHKVK